MNFTIGVQTGTLTVVPGKIGSYQFTITPVGPESTIPTPITLSLSGLPANYSYTLTSSSTSFNAGTSTIATGAGTTLVTLNVQTELNQSSAQAAPRSITSKLAPLALALLLLPFAGQLRKSGKRFSRMVSLLILLTAGAAAMAGVSGCSNTGFFAQTQQSYPLVMTGTSGALQNTSNITLTVE
jgi:hypothetical protein